MESEGVVMIRVGIIGMGFMGGVHFRNWQSLDDATVVAVCDANPITNTAVQGNLDLDSDELDLSNVIIYTAVAEMLANETLDAVSITLPTHLHKAISIQCLEAGVHVLCEKPMALSVADCDAMIDAANQADKQLMIAHCIRFWPVYAWAKKVIANGTYGKVLAADFSRLTFAPGWDDAGWLSDPKKSGGIALDLHIHDLDYMQYLFGEPQSVSSVSSLFDNGVPGHVNTSFDYGDGRAITATGSWMMPKSFGFQMAFSILLEKGALVLDSRSKDPVIVYPSEGEPFMPEIPEGEGYKAEIEYFAQLILKKEPEIVITPEQARISVKIALETLSNETK